MTHGPVICRLIGESYHRVDFDEDCAECEETDCPITVILYKLKAFELVLTNLIENHSCKETVKKE